MSHSIKDTDHGFRELRKRLAEATGDLTVGVHASEGDEAHENTSLTVLQVAAFQEFGTSRAPRRSFIADWSDENEEAHKAQLRSMAKAVIAGSVKSVDQGLQRLGNLYVGEVQRRIAQGIEPPLAESTIKRKGSSKPLIDTGQLRSSIRFKLGDGGSE